MRALRRLRKEAPHADFVFVSERGSPFSPSGFAKVVERAGEVAGFGFKAHPHMLRHACGYKLANDGKDTRSLQAYLGHKNIQHTVRYTELAPNRFTDFWRSPAALGSGPVVQIHLGNDLKRIVYLGTTASCFVIV